MRSSTIIALAMAVIIGLLSPLLEAKRRTDAAPEQQCEVCIEGFKQIRSDAKETLRSNPKQKIVSVYQDAVNKFCGDPQKPKKDLKDYFKKLCYYIQPISKDVAMNLMKAGKKDEDLKKACEKLGSEVCGVRKPLQVTKDTDYSKLRVKQLKAILADRGLNCHGCVEKSDYIQRIKESDKDL